MLIQMLSSLSLAAVMALMRRWSQMREFTTMPFTRFSPTRMHSMTVLKDASAGALYGARGANGVIMITTKQGT